jgi:uncharacterized protein YneF (UPF0154 family)
MTRKPKPTTFRHLAMFFIVGFVYVLTNSIEFWSGSQHPFALQVLGAALPIVAFCAVLYLGWRMFLPHNDEYLYYLALRRAFIIAVTMLLGMWVTSRLMDYQFIAETRITAHSTKFMFAGLLISYAYERWIDGSTDQDGEA